MKAEELSVGDYVCVCGRHEPINEISHKMVEFSGYIANIEELEPISITPNILKKSGFNPLESDPNSFVFSVDNGNIWAEYDFDLNNVLIVTPKKSFSGIVNYVHELQHVIRLCEIDIEIEL